MNQCTFAIQNHLRQVLAYSGRYIMQFGSYQDCLDHQTLLYNLIGIRQIGASSDMGFIGLCLPNSCSKSLIKTAIDTIFTTVHYPYQVSNVNNDISTYHYQYFWAYYLFVFLTLATFIGIIYASIFQGSSKLAFIKLQESLKIFQSKKQSNLNVFNGIRSISMIWIVLGHVYSSFITFGINISTSVEKNTLLTSFGLVIEGALFAVDVFFYLGGFLVAYSILKTQNKSIFYYLIAVVHRILRIWPCYLYAILFYYAFYLHIGSGPIWGQDQFLVKQCDNMWRSLLFIDNLVDGGHSQCMGWGWYLQNDVQLFIISLFLLFIYSRNKLIGKLSITLLCLASMVYVLIWTYQHNVSFVTSFKDVSRWNEFDKNLYVKPWARASAYLIGLLIGIFYSQFLKDQNLNKKSSDLNTEKHSILFKTQELFKKSKFLRLISQILGVFLVLFIIFIPKTRQQNIEWPQWLLSSYISLSRVLFVLGITLAILPTILGFRNSVVNLCLDTSAFNIMAKISFCTYLIHLTIIQTWIWSRSYNRYFTIVPTLVQFLGLLIISLGLGFIMTMMIQIPFSKLQSRLLKQISSRFINKPSSQLNLLKQSSEQIIQKDIIINSQARNYDINKTLLQK